MKIFGEIATLLLLPVIARYLGYLAQDRTNMIVGHIDCRP